MRYAGFFSHYYGPIVELVSPFVMQPRRVSAAQ